MHLIASWLFTTLLSANAIHVKSHELLCKESRTHVCIQVVVIVIFASAFVCSLVSLHRACLSASLFVAIVVIIIIIIIIA